MLTYNTNSKTEPVCGGRALCDQYCFDCIEDKSNKVYDNIIFWGNQKCQD